MSAMIRKPRRVISFENGGVALRVLQHKREAASRRMTVAFLIALFLVVLFEFGWSWVTLCILIVLIVFAFLSIVETRLESKEILLIENGELRYKHAFCRAWSLRIDDVVSVRLKSFASDDGSSILIRKKSGKEMTLPIFYEVDDIAMSWWILSNILVPLGVRVESDAIIQDVDVLEEFGGGVLEGVRSVSASVVACSHVLRAHEAAPKSPEDPDAR